MAVSGLRGLADVDRVIHEPARLTILAILNGVEEADFVFLHHQTGLTRGNLSSHVRKLEDAGYVAVEKTFVNRIPRTVYRLTPSGREGLARYRERLTAVMRALA